MLVWVTPLDVEHRRWRIEIWPDGRAQVWEMVGEWVSSAPLREPRSVGELGEWLVNRGIDPEDLLQA